MHIQPNKMYVNCLVSFHFVCSLQSGAIKSSAILRNEKLLPGSNQLNQQCISSVNKGLQVTKEL